MRVGVLALQGGYAAHLRAVTELGHTGVEVRTAADLERVDGLILPGGESTTQLKMLKWQGMTDALRGFQASGRPILATCAGMILAATSVSEPAQESFGLLDIDVARNGWGRQVHSFRAEADAGWQGEAPLALLFIRAPRITRVGAEVEVLVRFEGEPIAVRQGAIVAASFHPELTGERRLHRLVFGEAERAEPTESTEPRVDG